MSLKWQCVRQEGGYYELKEGVSLPVRIFLSENLYSQSEEGVYAQIKTATEFPGVKDVIITPDVHVGSVVPIGCVMATEETLCQAPVGYDIGCGMLAMRSQASDSLADDAAKLKFSRLVIDSIGMGKGNGSGRDISSQRFQKIIRHGAQALGYHRDNVERDFMPVDDGWDPPKDSKCWRGQGQLGSLGGGVSLPA